MKIYYRFSALAAICVALVSCSHQARIECTLTDAPEQDVIVKLLDVNSYKVLDTVRTNASGRMTYKMKVSEAQPEFVYLFRGDTKLASAVLLPGDDVKISADTLGHYEVSGSEESALLKEVEQSYAQFLGNIASIVAPLDGSAAGTTVAEINRAVSSEYLRYYRQAVSYIMTHSHSITSVPVCFQTVSEGFPVFNTTTDALHFRALSDSLSTVYPDSRYVKALIRETEKRESALALNINMKNAEAQGFPNIELPDISGQKVSLKDVDSKVILVHFWSSTDADQKLLNNDVILPLYEQYHSRGLEIYAVALDTDKPTWASVVKAQRLPWINVCDSRGAASPYAGTYNLAQLPMSFLIVDGEITSEDVSTGARLKAFLDKTLK